MKKLCLLALTSTLLAPNLLAQTADDFVNAGRAALVAHNLAGAYSNFNSAVSLDSSRGDANVLAAATRLLLLPQQPAGSNFLNRLGIPVAGRDIYNWSARFPTNASGDTILPANLNSGEGIALYTNAVMAAIRAGITNLGRVTDHNFTLSLSAEETSIQAATLDYGDVLLLRAFLQAADAFSHTLGAHNFNVVINHIRDLGNAKQLSIQRVLADYPSLLAQVSKSEQAASKTGVTNAINLYFSASDFIRNSRSNGVERLFNLDTNKLGDEATFRSNLAIGLASVDAPTVADPDDGRTVYAGAYFAGNSSLRSLVPKFNGDVYVNNSLPDYTLGGVLPDMPAWQTELALRKKFGFVDAGIYLGELDNWNGAPIGSLALFIATNGDATVLGFDSSQTTGISESFNVGKHGDWQFDNNGVQGFGNIYDDGSFYGQVYDNASQVSTQVSGKRSPSQGAFQNAAGLYTGTWSGGGQSGKLTGILTADGQMFFCPFGSSGQANDGGMGQFNGGGQFTTTTVSGATVKGALNSSTFRVTGTFTSSDSSGSFTVARSGSAPSDTPPSITAPLQDKTATAGDTVTFTPGVAGSAPLCYQWFSNGVALAHSTSSSLVLNNVQGSSAALYSVQIQNIAGQTNSAAQLNVVPEAVKPTLTITSPVSGRRVSNSVFTVTGTTKDNAAVANVWFQINDSDWAGADGTANWAAFVNLIPGTNVFRAFAVDTSGNFSTTNSVRFVYVVSAALTVQFTGPGTLTPNLSNATLEVGKTFTITARPATGYVLSNWVNGVGGILGTAPALSFTMGSNLVLQADIIPNPFLRAKGNYAGLFLETNGVATNSGFFTATLTDKGAFTSKLQFPGTSYSLAGQFSIAGLFSNSIPRSPLSVQLRADLSAGDYIGGIVGNGAWTATLTANRSVYSRTNPAPQAGNKYTLVIPGSADATLAPGGFGFGTFTVDALGNLNFTGVLGDGTRVMQRTFLSDQDLWPFFASPYAGRGVILGWLGVSNATDEVGGPVTWFRAAQPAAKLYQSGIDFGGPLNVVGGLYSPTNAAASLGGTNEIVILDGGNRSSTLTNPATLGANNRLTGTNKLSLTVTTASGLFTGTVTPPGGKATTLNGVLLQPNKAAYGTFLGTNQSGSVLVEPIH